MLTAKLLRCSHQRRGGSDPKALANDPKALANACLTQRCTDSGLNVVRDGGFSHLYLEESPLGSLT